MNNPPVILWFRNDLRVTDNPALNNALKISKNENRKIICIYILENYKDFSSNPGSASKWWLHGSLKKLDQQLTKLNEEQVSSSLNFLSCGTAEITAPGKILTFLPIRAPSIMVTLEPIQLPSPISTLL